MGSYHKTYEDRYTIVCLKNISYIYKILYWVDIPINDFVPGL